MAKIGGLPTPPMRPASEPPPLVNQDANGGGAGGAVPNGTSDAVVDAFERGGQAGDFSRLFGGGATPQAQHVGAGEAYEELSGASKRQVDATAKFLESSTPEAIEADVRKTLGSNPGKLWNMMEALKAGHPEAYGLATSALTSVFTNPQGLDLGKVVAEPYKKSPALLAETLASVAGTDGAAAKGVKQALAQHLGGRGLNYDLADLGFLRAAKDLGEGWGADVVKTTLAEHVAKNTGLPAKGMDMERAERLVAVQADGLGYLKGLELKRRYDPGGYAAELAKLQKDVLRPGLQGADGLFVNLDRLGSRIPSNDRDPVKDAKIQPMNAIKTDILRHLQANLKAAMAGGRPELAAGNAEQMARMLKHPGVARFMLDDQALRGELRGMVSSIAGVNGRMGQKLVGTLVDQVTRETAEILRRTDSKTFRGSDAAKHATWQLGMLLAAGQDALAKTLPSKGDAGTFVMKQLATTLISLVPGGKIVGGAAVKIGEVAVNQIGGKVGQAVDYGLDKAMAMIEDTGKPFQARLTAVADSLFHVVYDPRGEIRNGDHADPSAAERRNEYGRDSIAFTVELHNAYQAYQTNVP